MVTRRRSLSIAVVTTVVLTTLASRPTPARAAKPLHEVETSAAWEGFTKGQFQDAIAHAEICIREFRGAAGRRQKELTAVRKSVPIGVVGPEQKKNVHMNGPLNDVATCYYIKGRSADKLGRRAVAEAAFREAIKLPEARTWDSRGWFWSPAEAARLFFDDPALMDKSPHEIYTAEAWAAFNKGRHELAIVHATKCIEGFQQGAAEMQKALALRNAAVPIGAVEDGDVKRKVFENGLLNDVATCWFIKGRAIEETQKKLEAVRAYQGAAELTYGRCWDENGWFWSPAEAAADRLDILW